MNHCCTLTQKTHTHITAVFLLPTVPHAVWLIWSGPKKETGTQLSSMLQADSVLVMSSCITSATWTYSEACNFSLCPVCSWIFSGVTKIDFIYKWRWWQTLLSICAITSTKWSCQTNQTKQTTASEFIQIQSNRLGVNTVFDAYGSQGNSKLKMSLQSWQVDYGCLRCWSWPLLALRTFLAI